MITEKKLTGNFFFCVIFAMQELQPKIEKFVSQSYETEWFSIVQSCKFCIKYFVSLGNCFFLLLLLRIFNLFVSCCSDGCCLIFFFVKMSLFDQMKAIYSHLFLSIEVDFVSLLDWYGSVYSFCMICHKKQTMCRNVQLYHMYFI